jgi:membrane protease YdiL (CAAX protease family)
LLLSIKYIVLLRHDITWADIGIGRLQGRWLRLGIFGGFLCLPLVAMINLFVQGTMQEPIDNPQIEALTGGDLSPAMLFVLLPVGAIIVPFAEEVAFRGILFRWLSLKTGGRLAILASALFFAVLHGIPHFIPAITALGVVLAVLVQRTGSLWPAIIAHGTFNAVMIFTVYSLTSAEGTLPAASLGGP